MNNCVNETRHFNYFEVIEVELMAGQNRSYGDAAYTSRPPFSYPLTADRVGFAATSSVENTPLIFNRMRITSFRYSMEFSARMYFMTDGLKAKNGIDFRLASSNSRCDRPIFPSPFSSKATSSITVPTAVDILQAA